MSFSVMFIGSTRSFRIVTHCHDFNLYFFFFKQVCEYFRVSQQQLEQSQKNFLQLPDNFGDSIDIQMVMLMGKQNLVPRTIYRDGFVIMDQFKHWPGSESVTHLINEHRALVRGNCYGVFLFRLVYSTRVKYTAVLTYHTTSA